MSRRRRVTKSAVIRKEAAAPSGQPDQFHAVGHSGLDQSAGYITEEFLRELRGRRGMEKLREMGSNDAISSALLTLVRLLFQNTEKRLVPANANDEQALECAEFIRECQGDMDHTWAAVEDEFLTSCIYGYALMEVVLKVRGGNSDDPAHRSAYSDGRIAWQSIRLRKQTSIERWEFDQQLGRFVAALQWTQDGKQARIPLDRCIHFRTNDALDNPEGISLLRGGYRSWVISSNLEESEAIALDRAAGFPVMEVPPSVLSSTDPDDSTRIQQLVDAMSGVRHDTKSAIIVPASKVEGVETGYAFRLEKTEVSHHDVAIRRHESRRAMTLFGDFLLLGHDKAGSWALASEKTSLAALAISAILKRFCETFTRQAIEPLCALNGFPQECWPRLEHGDVEAPDLEALAGFVNTLVGAEILTRTPELEDYLLERGKLPRREQADFTRPEDGVEPGAAGPVAAPASERVGITIQYLSLAMERALAAGDTGLRDELANKIRALLGTL